MINDPQIVCYPLCVYSIQKTYMGQISIQEYNNHNAGVEVIHLSTSGQTDADSMMV